MRFNILILAGTLAAAVAAPLALAYSHANRYGGSTEHSYGQTSHTNAYGGSTSHAYGEGTEHTNMYGGSTAHAWGGGTEHTNVYGGSTYGAAGAGVAHTTPYGATAYRPPYPAGGDVLPLSSTGRRPLLRIDRLLRLRGGSRRSRWHGGRRRGRVGEYRGGDLQRLFVRLRGRHGNDRSRSDQRVRRRGCRGSSRSTGVRDGRKLRCIAGRMHHAERPGAGLRSLRATPGSCLRTAPTAFSTASYPRLEMSRRFARKSPATPRPMIWRPLKGQSASRACGNRGILLRYAGTPGVESWLASRIGNARSVSPAVRDGVPFRTTNHGDQR